MSQNLFKNDIVLSCTEILLRLLSRRKLKPALPVQYGYTQKLKNTVLVAFLQGPCQNTASVYSKDNMVIYLRNDSFWDEKKSIWGPPIAMKTCMDITVDIPDAFRDSATPTAPGGPIPPPLGLLSLLPSNQRPATLDEPYRPKSMDFQ